MYIYIYAHFTSHPDFVLLIFCSRWITSAVDLPLYPLADMAGIYPDDVKKRATECLGLMRKTHPMPESKSSASKCMT